MKCFFVLALLFAAVSAQQCTGSVADCADNEFYDLDNCCCSPCALDCKNGATLYNNMCKCDCAGEWAGELCDECPAGNYVDECTGECKPCACGCKTCDGPTNWSCDSCEEGYYLFDMPMTKEECDKPANQFVHSDGSVSCPDESCRKCSNTMPHCIACTWFNECHCCEAGWDLNEDKTGCVKIMA